MAGSLGAVAKIAEKTKCPALLSRIVGQGTHGHEAHHFEPLEPRELIQQAGQGVWSHAALLGLGRAVDLHQNPLPTPLRHPAVEIGGEIDPVDRMNEPKASGCVTRLVPLQRAHQVPLDRHLWQRLLLLQRFLDPVLSYIPESCRDGRPHCLRPVRLGHRDDPHPMPPPSQRLVTSHLIPHGGQPARKVWEIHNPLIYLRMVRY